MIASNVPGCKDIIVDKKNGFLFDINDKKDFLNKVNEFLKMSTRQKEQLSEYCHNSVKKYDINKITSIYFDLINEKKI